MTRLTAASLTSLSLRARITAWYVLLTALTLIAFSSFLYFRLQSSLISQVDAALESASFQALSTLEMENEYAGEIASFALNSLVLRDGTTFEINEETEMNVSPAIGIEVEVDAALSSDGLVALEVDEADAEEGEQEENPGKAILDGLDTGEFVSRIVNSRGTVWDELGDHKAVPFPSPEGASFITVRSENGVAWRVHNLELDSSESRPAAWLQTAQPLESVDAALDSVRTQLFWGVPLAIVLASLGGLFLAERGLRPIDRITRTAQSITGDVLNRRINYHGPNDEVGRLAKTFDAMLERLERAFERERRFTADASHELRTPLTSLKGRIDVTLSRPRSEPEYEDTLRGLDEEVGRLIRLSDELLFLARLDQSRLSWETEEISLSNLLGAVVDQIRPLAESRKLDLIEEVPDGIVIPGDPDHLIRLFLNLVDNACKYTPAGGRVTVQAESSPGEVRVSISDTGPGIPQEHIPHLFERFYRVDRARSREAGGTGLGLAIAYEIAQLHKGKLEVLSEVGGGSAFIVTLPANNDTPVG